MDGVSHHHVDTPLLGSAKPAGYLQGLKSVFATGSDHDGSFVVSCKLLSRVFTTTWLDMSVADST